MSYPVKGRRIPLVLSAKVEAFKMDNPREYSQILSVIYALPTEYLKKYYDGSERLFSAPLDVTKDIIKDELTLRLTADLAAEIIERWECTC